MSVNNSYTKMKKKYELSEKNSTVIKCVLVGDTGVGKTSLAARITSRKFKDEYIPTIFDNYAATVLLDQKPFHLSLFDTAGKEDYEKLRVISYLNCNVFLICFSAVDRDSLANVEKRWVPEIRHYLPNTPYILVCCKTDLRGTQNVDGVKSFSEVSSNEASDVTDRCGASCYAECSSQTTDGISNVIQGTIETVLKFENSERSCCKCTII